LSSEKPSKRESERASEKGQAKKRRWRIEKAGERERENTGTKREKAESIGVFLKLIF
jgi:hypothetical protein